MCAKKANGRKLELTPQQRKEQLAEQEQLVKQHLASELPAAEALYKIQSRDLYKDDYETFAEYVKARFGKTRQWAYDAINWYQIIQIVGEKESNVLTVAAARPLKSVRSKKAVVKKIVAEAKKLATAKEEDLMAKHVKEAKRKIMGTTAKSSKAKKVKPLETVTTVVKDLTTVSDTLRSVRSDPLSDEEEAELKEKVKEMIRLVAEIKDNLVPWLKGGF